VVSDVHDIPAVRGITEPQAKALLENAKANFARVTANFDGHEQKAARYVAVVAVIVTAVNVIVVPEVLRILSAKVITRAEATFVGVVGVMLFFALLAVVQMGRVLRVEAVPAPSTNPKQLFDAFTTQTVECAYVGEAWRLLEATDSLDKLNERRGELLTAAYEAMIGSIGLYPVVLGISFLLKL
jgi:hypothetical protein